jgi:methyl-accepting chemotaxis protein
MTLQSKLLTSKLALAIVPAATIAAIILWQTSAATEKTAASTEEGLKSTSETAKEALVDAGFVDLEHVAENVHAMCLAQQELLQQTVRKNLSVVDYVLHQTGPVTFADETVTWQAANQYTQAVTPSALPKMMLGDAWLGQNTDVNTKSPVVDTANEIVDCVCTVFQRMNDAGDLLRVCTTQHTPDGKRAIGTYVPAVNPDGTPNPVASAIKNGTTFYGRARVLNNWCITAYKPVFDEANNVVGALGVAVPEESATSLRKAIMDIKVGQTGYVYVLNANGASRGHYVISAGGKRDGEDISAAKDANGKLFIQEVCDIALGLKPGEIGQSRYAWKNPGDPAPRDKVVKIAYFEPWDWVIGVGSYEDEFFGAVKQMENEGADQVNDAAAQVAAPRSTGRGASEQASSLEENLQRARGRWPP